MKKTEAESWLDKGNEAFSSLNFEEAAKYYAKVAQLSPNSADVFHNWGSAISFAIINDDESLFKQAFDKFEKAAELDPDNYSVFISWGSALFQLAKIKNDESLFGQAFEKYEKATQLKPDDTNTFFIWGSALCELAKIKNDESFFRQAFEKYEKAVQLNPDYTNAFLNWGFVLFDLAKITKEESLFSESVQCFKKSKKDILNILIAFNNEKWKYIQKQNLFSPLLEPDTADGQFFEEITKNADKNERDNYKKAYLLSAYIISQLHVTNSLENLVAHYREKTISYKMLFDDSKFRLNAINYSNDPREGETLLDYLYQNRGSSAKKPLNTDYIAFAGCFSFNYDSLTQFRLYGKEDGREGSGLSLVFRKSFFSEEARMPSEQSLSADKNVKPEEEKQALFRCIYVDPETQRVETVGQKDEYLFYREGNDDGITDNGYCNNYIINNIINTTREKMEELKNLVQDLDQEVIGQLLINLRYLTKHIAFKEEQECRIVKIHNLKDEKIRTSDNFKQMYVEYEPKVSSHIEKIYFGPNADGMKLFQDILTHKGLAIPCEQSKNPLA